MTRLADTGVPEAVLAAACAGDEAARAAIYTTLAPLTLTLIRRLVGAHAVAEDIFQETMMIFYERLPQFRREAPLGAWLRQIAISRCLMHLRSPWRRARASLTAADSGLAPEVAPLATSGYDGELIDIERALARLSSTARTDALERRLASQPDEPALVRVGTRAALTDLEDHIAQLDDLLSAARAAQDPPAALLVLQKERTRLVGALLEVRYAETLAHASR